MSPIRASITALVMAVLLSQGQAVADTACEAAPTPECILDLAHASANQIKVPAAKADALTRIAVAEAAAGYVEQSESSLALARLIADGTGLADGLDKSDYGPRSDEDIRSSLYRGIIAARARSGASLSALTAMIDEVPDLEYKLMLTYVAAEALVETDRAADARPLLDSLLVLLSNDENTERAMAIRSMVAMMYVETGDFATAMSMVRELPDNDETLTKFGLLTRISEAQREAGDKTGAEATLLSAEQAIPAIENTEMQEMARNMLSSVRAMHSEGESKTAKQTGSCPADLSPYGLAVDKAKFGFFDEALQMALALEDPEERERALSRIASLQREEGQLDGAYETALMISESYNRSFALGEVAQAYAEAGDADGAWTTAQAITEDFERNNALAQSIAPLVTAGNAAGAARLSGGMADPGQRVAAYASLVENMLDAEAGAQENPEPGADGEEQLFR